MEWNKRIKHTVYDQLDCLLLKRRKDVIVDVVVARNQKKEKKKDFKLLRIVLEWFPS